MKQVSGILAIIFFSIACSLPVQAQVGSLVKDFIKGSAGIDANTGFTATEIAVVDNKVFLNFESADNVYQLWSIDKDNAAAPALVKTFQPNAPHHFTAIGKQLFFLYEDANSGTELWKTDGTPWGTVQVKDIYPGTGSSSPNSLIEFKGSLYFIANDGSSEGIWKSDGTESGTVLVKAMNFSVSGANGRLAKTNNLLFFAAVNTANGNELWESDGTAGGTQLVKDINGGSEGSDPSDLTNVNGILYFAAYSSATGLSLWKSDGTTSGTQLVKQMGASGIELQVKSFTAVGNLLFFAAKTASVGIELWKSNGTDAGTVLVKDCYVGAANSNPDNLTPLNGALYFTTTDSISTKALWKSDGSAAGTAKIKDIYPGGDPAPYGFKVLNDRLYFGATSPNGGTELWQSDGFTNGTKQVYDLYAGKSNSRPAFLTTASDHLFFLANDGIHGTELWKIGPCAAAIRRIEKTETIPCEGGGLGLSIPIFGEGLSQRWQSPASGTTFTNLNTSTNYSGVSSTKLILAKLPYSFNNYVYRCSFSGTCTANTFSDTMSIAIYPAPALDAGPDRVLCIGDSTQLKASGALSYVWDHGVQNGDVVKPQQNTTYTVEGTGEHGCKKTDAVTLTVVPLPVVDAGPDLVACANEQLILFGSGAKSYTWDKGVLDSVPFKPVKTDTYTMVGLDSNGCSASDQVLVEVLPAPDRSIEKPTANTLRALESNAIYQWLNCSDNLPVEAATAREFSPKEEGDYAVVVKNNSGCTDTSDCLHAVPPPLSVRANALNAVKLSPNPTQNLCYVESEAFLNELSIYDAMGRCLHKSVVNDFKAMLDLSDYPEGYYIIRIYSNAGASAQPLLRIRSN